MKRNEVEKTWPCSLAAETETNVDHPDDTRASGEKYRVGSENVNSDDTDVRLAGREKAICRRHDRGARGSVATGICEVE